MKKLLLLLTFLLPQLILAEYNGVQIEFKVQFLNDKTIKGYKFIAHGTPSESFKETLETSPEILFKNEFTFEPGDFGYYQNRLEYKYLDIVLYKTIHPININLNTIKSISIIDMRVSSYDIQITSTHKWEDQQWMNTKPLFQYSESQDMCTYDIYIHQTETIPKNVLDKIKEIITQTNQKIKTKEEEIKNNISSDQEYNEHMKGIYNERERLLKPIFKNQNNLKIISISLCTC